MNEPPSRPPSNDPLLAAFLGRDSLSDARDQQIAELQNEVQAVRRHADEERFLWVLVLVVIVDIAFLGSMANWSAPVVIGVIEMIGLVIWSDKCGVKAVAPLVDRISGMIAQKAK